jgi:deoxyribonuclease IV
MISINYIGAHIKRDDSGGIIETMNNIKNNGGNALQIFVSNPRSITITNIDSYIKKSQDIRKYLVENNFKLVIHAPYTINIAKDSTEGKRIMPLEECIWIKLLINQLTLADMMNAEGVILHCGKHVSLTYEKGLNNMKTSIEYILKIMENKKMKTKLIIETPAGQGTELLKDLNNFLTFFNGFSKEQKKNLGICLDTAHTWALGYELAEAYNILFKKNSKDITVIHLNNSLVKKGEMKDRHSVLLDGKIPVADMNDFIASLSGSRDNVYSQKSSKYIPTIILETPSENYEMEINHIRNLLD